MATKVEAARIATGAGHPGRAHRRPSRPPRALAGDAGRHAVPRPPAGAGPTRLLWLAHATEPQGRLLLDAGAVRAVVERRASLLPAGITGVDGHVRRPATRSTWSTPTGAPVARGLVNFDADELPGAARPLDPRAGRASSARRTSARSSTATTSSCSDPRQLSDVACALPHVTSDNVEKAAGTCSGSAVPRVPVAEVSDGGADRARRGRGLQRRLADAASRAGQRAGGGHGVPSRRWPSPCLPSPAESRWAIEPANAVTLPRTSRVTARLRRQRPV